MVLERFALMMVMQISVYDKVVSFLPSNICKYTLVSLKECFKKSRYEGILRGFVSYNRTDAVGRNANLHRKKYLLGKLNVFC